MAELPVRRIVQAVADAADHGLELWAGGRTRVKRWEKIPGQPVSDADLALDRMLFESLMALDPAAGWLSEETADSAARLGNERLWVVDPIDGTRDYLRGRPGWAVSVALVERGQPRLGVLAAPARNELWVAVAGEGATRNGTRLRTSDRTRLAGARMPADALPKDSELIAVHKPNSIALRMAMVASGEADLLTTAQWGNEWDIAAALLIAGEAGATVTDAFGAPIVFNREHPSAFGVVCAAPGIHAAAVELIEPRARALRDRPAG